MTQTPTTPAWSDQLTARLLHQRIVLLGGELDDASAHRLCVELLLLSGEDPHAGISLYLSSPGGSTAAALAVHDTVRLIPNEVGTLAMGQLAGPGVLLLAAGTPGRRHALPHARVLMGQEPGDNRAGDPGDPDQVVLGLLAERTGQGREAVEQDSRRWLTAEQARERGIVDEVLGDAAAVVRGPRRTGLGLDDR